MKLTYDPYILTKSRTILGIVDVSLPMFGLSVVRPKGDMYNTSIVCRNNIYGGNFGAAAVQAPPLGSMVTVNIGDILKAYIISQTINGVLGPLALNADFTHTYLWNTPIENTQFFDVLITLIAKWSNYQRSAPCGGLLDMYGGDLYLADRQGGGVFIGRGMITVKGSPLAYSEYSAVSNKINHVAHTILTSTFTDYCCLDLDVNKSYKASCDIEGLGQLLKLPFTVSITGDGAPGLPANINLEELEDNDPVFRSQNFSGGALRGLNHSMWSFDKEVTDLPGATYSTFTDYNGRDTKFSISSIRSIKSAYFTGLRELRKDEELESDDVETPALSLEAVDLVLQLLKILKNASVRERLKALLDVDLEKLGKNKVTAQSNTIKDTLEGWTAALDELKGRQTAEYYNKFTKLTLQISDNNSFITQEKDGSIIIKDGWGSQIIMSKGNIYISSALDTFIRPGRDMIGLIPGKAELDANGEFVIASKEKLSLASEKDATLSSGVGGDSGYTVIENRASLGDTGVVIRSNGNLSLTSSQNMMISLNDKRTTNKEDKADEGEGTIEIVGGTVAVKALNSLMLVGLRAGLYSYSGSTGSGVQLSSSQVTISAANINLATSYTRLGKFDVVDTIEIPNSDKTFTLNTGSSLAYLLIKGTMTVKGITANGPIQTLGNILGRYYMTINSEPQKEISPIKQWQVDRFRKQIHKALEALMKYGKLSITVSDQKWYNDNYICNHLLKFSEGLTGTVHIPSMSWQLDTGVLGSKALLPITIIPTGKTKEVATYTYPGKQGWEEGMLSELDDKYQVIYKKAFKEYKTNVKGN